MLYVIFRVALAVFIAIFLTKVLFRFLNLDGFNDSEAKSSKKSHEDIIDICPECGRVKKRGHTCP